MSISVPETQTETRLSCFKDGEETVTDEAELWHRVCADSDNTWDSDNEVPSSMMFHCGTEDDGELSGTRSSKTTPQETMRHQVEDQHKPSKGVWSIAVKDLTSNALHLHDDSPILDGPPTTPEGHTWLDLKHLPAGKKNPAKQERARMRNLLLDKATKTYPLD